MLKKQNAKNILKLKNANHAKKKRSIISLNIHYKRDIIYVLKKEVFTLIWYAFYIYNIIKT